MENNLRYRLRYYKKIDMIIKYILSPLHPVLEILKTVQSHLEKSEVLEKVLLKPPKVTFMNPKTLKNKLVLSNFKIPCLDDQGKSVKFGEEELLNLLNCI